MKALILALACAIALAATCASASDINFGATARSTGMGGAGIALGDDLGTTAVLNPAAPAVMGQRFRLIFPGLDFHSTGASFGDLTDSISKLSDGSTDDALDLVSDFGTHPTKLSFSSVAGFAGTTGVTVEGEAQGIITPGPETAKWATVVRTFDSSDLNSFQPQNYSALIDNTNLSNAVANWHLTSGTPNTADNAVAEAAFDAYLGEVSANGVQASLVYALPAVQVSRGLTTRGGRLWVGANTKFLHSEARTWQVVGASDSFSYDGASRLTGVDMSFDAVEGPVLKSTSLKVDVGAIYKPNNSMLQYGFVINNFIEPDLDGITDMQAERTLSVGIAAVPNRNLVLAADIVNINGANGENASLRFGGEFRLGRLFAARAGYSGSKWTYGAQVFGLNVSWAGRSAQLLANVLKF